MVTIGFVKDAVHHIDVQGFNVYHKNRLIKVCSLPLTTPRDVIFLFVKLFSLLYSQFPYGAASKCFDTDLVIQSQICLYLLCISFIYLFYK